MEVTEEMLAALQRGLPLGPRPFKALAREARCGEDELLAAVAALREEGKVRRFGAVFDTRRLGYRSALCACDARGAELDRAVAELVPRLEVTHCYERLVDSPLREGDELAHPPHPNLWFTFSAPAESFDAGVRELSERLSPLTVHVLPALKRFKVDVVFGASSRAREEAVADDLPCPDERDRAIIAALQGDTEARADYFTAIADSLGMKEWDLLSTLEVWRRRGRLKRIGLLLAHRHAGWTANGMCCWNVAGDTTAAGRLLASRDEVTHCYERPHAPGFPYNLFAMIHARSIESARAQFASLAEALTAEMGELPSAMLVSTCEFKKTSMTFFAGAR